MTSGHIQRRGSDGTEKSNGLSTTILTSLREEAVPKSSALKAMRKKRKERRSRSRSMEAKVSSSFSAHRQSNSSLPPIEGEIDPTLQTNTSSDSSISKMSVQSDTMMIMQGDNLPSPSLHRYKGMPHRSKDTKRHSIIQALMEACKKEHMLDVTLVGKDGICVKAIRYVLACRNEGLEKMLYADGEKPATVKLGDYDEVVLNSLIEYCVTGEISSLLDVQDGHCLVQLADLAASFKFGSLKDDSYQMARRLMNRRPSIACSFYEHSAHQKEFEMYAQQTIEDCPIDALLGKDTGVQFLSPSRFQTLMKNSDLEDMEELQLFHVLLKWHQYQGQTQESLEICKNCAKEMIDLRYIGKEHLTGSILRQSGFFSESQITDALQQQMMARRFSCLPASKVEHVRVEGAGLDEVNGIYIRHDDTDGQVMYVDEEKEEIGLCQWGRKWIIAPVHDLSNILYSSVEIEPDMVPQDGWRVFGRGSGPPPTCTWHEGNSTEFDICATERSEDLPACFQHEQDLYGN